MNFLEDDMAGTEQTLKGENEVAIEAFRKALMQQAYEDFLAWARAKDELMEQWCEYVEDNPGTDKTFTIWVTETYWGEVE